MIDVAMDFFDTEVMLREQYADEMVIGKSEECRSTNRNLNVASKQHAALTMNNNTTSTRISK